MGFKFHDPMWALFFDSFHEAEAWSLMGFIFNHLLESQLTWIFVFRFSLILFIPMTWMFEATKSDLFWLFFLASIISEVIIMLFTIPVLFIAESGVEIGLTRWQSQAKGHESSFKSFRYWIFSSQPLFVSRQNRGKPKQASDFYFIFWVSSSNHTFLSCVKNLQESTL